jgi:heme oxygenase
MSKKDAAIPENLAKIIELAHELGWKSLLIADESLNTKGVLCGPDKFIEDFKAFSADMAQLERDLEKFYDANNLDEALPKAEKVTKNDKKDDGNDGGETYH